MDHASFPRNEVSRLISRSHRQHFERNRGHSKCSRHDYACENAESKKYKMEKTNRKKDTHKKHEQKTKKMCERCAVEDYSSAISDQSSIHDESNSNLAGLFQCETCNVTLNSHLTYNSHMNGKKHRKSLRTKNPEAISKSVSSFVTEDQRKYPRPPKGILRTRINVRAKLQDVIERQFKIPCPGLNFITEIRGIKDIRYYCFLCDKVRSRNRIIEHLTGFKHRMKFLKYIKPDIYKYLKDMPRHKVNKRIIKILRYVENKEETGKIVVEKDILSTEPRRRLDDFRRDNPSTSRVNAIPSASDPKLDVPFNEKYKINAAPDMSHSDFYCRVCHSHMNSLSMWEMHIIGKRHIANLKKSPGNPPSKTKTIPIPNAKAYLLERLEVEKVSGPIVGLDEIQEIQIPELRTEQYQCFLCGASLSSADIIHHLLTVKHRQKYLNHIDFPGREAVNFMGERATNILIEEMCAQVEATEGRGNPSVHITKRNALWKDITEIEERNEKERKRFSF